MQEFVVFLIVGAAATYLVRHWWLATKSDSSCGGCKSCPSSAKSAEPQLVQIDLNGSFRK